MQEALFLRPACGKARLFSIHLSLPGLGDDHTEHCWPPRFALDLDPTIVGFNNPVADAQAKPHSCSHLFFREEGVENMIQIFGRDPWPIILNLYLHIVLSAPGRRNRDPWLNSALAGPFEGLGGVLNQVHHDLAKLVRIAAHQVALRHLYVEGDPLKLPCQQSPRIFDGVRKTYLLLQDSLPFGKGSQITHNPDDPVHALLRISNRLFKIRALLLLHIIGIHPEGMQRSFNVVHRVIHLMNDARAHPAQRGKSFCLQ